MPNLKRLQNRPEGAPAPLRALSENKFQFAQHTYPLSIDQLSHCILFNVNVHSTSRDFGSGSSGTGSRESTPRTSRETRSPSEAPRYNQNTRYQSGYPGLTRKTVRTERAIALHVPDTVVFDATQRYETPSLLDKFGLGGVGLVTGASKAGIELSALIGGASAIAAAAARGTAGLGKVIAAVTGANRIATNAAKTGVQVFGYAINPVIEVMYQHPELRKFRFDFVFSPRNDKEADSVWEIIYEFRRHAAPEFLDNSGGLILVPPSDFDITFMRKSSSGFVENTNIPRISTCALQDVMVDYASAGQYATFTDGMPIQIRMTLSFIELGIITREDIDKGY